MQGQKKRTASRAMRLSCAAVCVAGLGVAAPASFGAAFITYEAQVGTAPGPVLLAAQTLRVDATGGLQPKDYAVNWHDPVAPPLSTAASIALEGRVKWDGSGNKDLGVRTTVEGYVSGFDTQNPPPPNLGVIEGTVTAHVDAIIDVSAPGYAAGSLVGFQLLSPLVRGRLLTPVDGPAGTGLASIHGIFILSEYDGTDFFGNQILGASQARVFEIIVDSQTPPNAREFSQSGSIYLPTLQAVSLDGGPSPPPVGNANPAFTVENGRRYLAVLEFYARASLQPQPTTTGAPSPQIFASSAFAGTLHWGGFSDFTDAAGNPLEGVQLLGDDGLDWRVASSSYVVPLPPAVVLISGALGLLVTCRRRGK